MKEDSTTDGLRLTDRVLVTGGTGLIGRNLCDRLKAGGFEVTAVGSEVDLRDAAATRALFERVRPTFVFHLAARVGGIYANSHYKAGFYSDNVLINTHVVNACVEAGVRFVFAMGTGCAYPKRLEGVLLDEDVFLDGTPEPTNDAYAYAKRGLLVHLRALHEVGALDYCYCLPANIYGPHDNFHPLHSHVVPALIRRFCEAADAGAATVEVWGTGRAGRDFLYVGDCVDAMVRLAHDAFHGPVNVATGAITSIRELAEAIGRSSGFKGEIVFDASKPEGQTSRLFATERIATTGWGPTTTLDDGIDAAVRWFREHATEVRER